MRKQFTILSIIFMSCGGSIPEVQNDKIISRGRNITVIEVDGCQYVIFEANGKGGIVHKANCPNPEHK